MKYTTEMAFYKHTAAYPGELLPERKHFNKGSGPLCVCMCVCVCVHVCV